MASQERPDDHIVGVVDDLASEKDQPEATGETLAGGFKLPLPRWQMVAVMAFVVVLIQIGSYFFPPFLFPDVPAVASALVEIFTGEWATVYITVQRFLTAVLCALVMGWFFGLLMGIVRPIGELLEPVFSLVLAIPALSWILVAVLWFRGIELRIFFVVFVIALPFYVVSVYEGTKALDAELLEGTEQFRPTRLQVVRILLIPHSVPYVVLTTKSVAGLTMRILVFAELIGAGSGMGSAMSRAQAAFRIDRVFAWTIMLVLVSFAFLAVVRWIELKVLKWRPESVKK